MHSNRDHLADAERRVESAIGVVAASLLGEPGWRLDQPALQWALAELLERAHLDLLAAT